MVKGVVSRVEEAFSYLKEFNITSVMVRLLLAVVSGALIGYGREKKERNAGLRTYMLISIGSALTILISFYENDLGLDVGEKYKLTVIFDPRNVTDKTLVWESSNPSAVTVGNDGEITDEEKR